jgi:hypothetical protein
MPFLFSLCYQAKPLFFYSSFKVFLIFLPVLMQWFMIISPRDPGATRQRAAQTSPHLTPGK